MEVGTAVVGLTVGQLVDLKEGETVGKIVGFAVGRNDVGVEVVGLTVGQLEDLKVGATVGKIVGFNEG